MTGELFEMPPGRTDIDAGVVLLTSFVPHPADCLKAIEEITHAAPFRQMQTPGGFTMSVAMTNCGDVGWVSDRSGYRYSPVDPETQKPWPAMPQIFLVLASSAAAEAGFSDFAPDACLINRYRPGAKMSLHQDKDERDFSAPIVSVSLGLPATFLFGGLTRKDRPQRFGLHHGDVIVWGGPARKRYHGIALLADGNHPEAGAFRYNLTFRKAL